MAPPQILVDIAALLDAGPQVTTGVTRLRELRDRLDGINGRLQASATISQDTDLDDKINSFHTKWKDELDIVAKMAEGFGTIFTSAAEAFSTVDTTLMQAIQKLRDSP